MIHGIGALFAVPRTYAHQSGHRGFGNAFCYREQPGINACILKATESLPRIPGLVIKKTRTRPVPAEILATWKGQERPIIVDVDIVATGAEETYSYLCALTKGSAYVRRVMGQ